MPLATISGIWAFWFNIDWEIRLSHLNLKLPFDSFKKQKTGSVLVSAMRPDIAKTQHNRLQLNKPYEQNQNLLAQFFIKEHKFSHLKV